MIIELEMLHEKLAHIPGFPDELKILIEHMIISHHGQYEFGSPKLPMFPEALMLHYLDDLDSKMESMRAQFEREAELETAWTSYNPSLARPLLNTQKFLEKGLAAPVPAAAKAEPEDLFAETESVPASASEGEEASSSSAKAANSSPLDALQRKFASHKITPVGAKTE
jgi:3'-5' exoribonuclease